MRIIDSTVILMNPPSYSTLLKTIEAAGRTCYKSEHLIAKDSAEALVRKFIGWGHESALEHSAITVKFICDRGVSHEIVRHRIAAYSQESTRYCNYSKDGFGGEITVIKPSTFADYTEAYATWEYACECAEDMYFKLLDIGCTPQQARAVLPNSLKTELVMTANIREWRHFLKLRTDKAAHPDIRVVARKLLDLFKEWYPVFFEDISYDN